MNESIWGDKKTEFFYQLTPEAILNAVDKLGFNTSGRVLTLNSMENRVYEVEVFDNQTKQPYFLIAKFYRPGRWSKEQILDEHEFLIDLDQEEVPVIAPVKVGSETLFYSESTELFFALFPKKGGRAPEEMNQEELEILGRQLARLHNVGSLKKAEHRQQINPKTFGTNNLNYLLDAKVIPSNLEASYQKMVENIIKIINPLFENVRNIRIHGDCHKSNIILRPGEGLFFIDFDDMLMGPPVQDIWLIVPGQDEIDKKNRDILLDAYESMRDFDFHSLKLIEPLRTLRYIHFTTWIAKRWDDKSFKNAFPYFGTEDYWRNQYNDLNEQLNLIGAL